ncbi:MAG: D-alanine--D-alanine ligase [Clostridiales bacterium]|nr:D-alanine--D-alanine ligase [Clostridiales bacterium]
MNIVVLAGGLSTERDVSLTTGSMVSRALRERGHCVIMLDVYLGYEGEDCDIADVFSRSEEVGVTAGAISAEAPDLAQVKAMRGDSPDGFFGPNVIRICQAADFVFMALHGENGEDGRIQAAFDLLGIRYTGTGYLSSALAMDKGISKEMFEAAGIPTPHGISMKKEAPVAFAQTGMTLPCVVKPCCGGSSIGVSIVRTEEEFDEALAHAFQFEEKVIVEDYVKGREFSVGVIDYEALPVIEIAPIEGFYDYANKYKAGSTVETCPADLPAQIAERMQQIAVQACETLGLDTYSRMDFLLNDKNELFCLEANTLPGMTPTSLLPQEAAAVGMDFPTLCEHLIQISQEKYE